MAGRLHLCQDRVGSRSVARIDEYAELLRPRQQLAQESYPLSHRFCRQIVEARAKLVTSPSATGSSATPKTIGIVAVASLAARAPGSVPGGTLTLTLRRGRSDARSGST